MRVPNHVIRELAAGAPELAEAFWWQALLAIDVQREWMVSLGRRSAIERLAHLFCEIPARLAPVGLSDGYRCDCPRIQADMADVLGLSSVHVNRSLQQLKSASLIETRDKRLWILDRPKLEALAMFDPTYLHLPHGMARRPELERGTRPSL